MPRWCCSHCQADHIDVADYFVKREFQWADRKRLMVSWSHRPVARPGRERRGEAMKLTGPAVEQLKALIVEHPEDPIVRVQVKDVDDQRLAFSITLEDRVQPDDQAQTIDGLTVAVPTASAARMEGITMDYQDPGGFKFHHTNHQDEPPLDLIKLN
jgi:Fe-S cluster assembly iron-binding protein IscA